jgi:hypothetical protein
MAQEFVDITPSPRILRTLGEIPFAPWQCLAELIDNSLDAFQSADAAGAQLRERRVVVSWSGEATAPADQTLEVLDTGPGMDIDVLQNSVRAGYSSNNPINTLGLFGMGFNIATARLGEKTLIVSAKSGATEWLGVEIDFGALTKTGGFNAPLRRVPKRSPSEQGTRIIVSKLRPGIASTLRSNGSQIRRILESIYTPLLQTRNVEIMVQSKVLSPAPHCLWDEKRYVANRDETTPAIIAIDEPIGEALFDVEKNRYLTPDEEADIRRASGNNLPKNIVARNKRITGWIGIQRYPDPDDFGLDFIRNGRKVLIGDKSLFSYQNPLTGRSELEYPVELGNTVGGRIVGELHVNHIPPTYQKNDFDRSDPSWSEMVEYLRGPGPVLPNKRKAMGFDTSNVSPLSRLITAYRRTDIGTRCLAAPHRQAREWAERFRKGEPEYLLDEKWWKAAQEADRLKADKGAAEAPAVDTGNQSSDDPSAYGPAAGGSVSAVSAQATSPTAPRETNSVEDLKARSKKIESFSGDYGYEGCRSPFNVTVWELTSGKIGAGDTGNACALLSDGNTCDFFYNPRHPFLASFPYGPTDLLLLYLAERFKARDGKTDIASLFVGLVQEKFSDNRIEHGRIQEVAKAFFDRLREAAVQLLVVREQEALNCIHLSAGEVEETVGKLTSRPELLQKFQSRSIGAIDALSVVPSRTLIRLVDAFPEEFLDGKFFRMPYSAINLPDQNATERLRGGAKERLLSYLKDALWILSDADSSGPPQRRKNELARCAHSLSFLSQETET